MCKAFSCVVTIGNKVYWKAGIDSHDEIINEFKADDKDLADDKPAPYNTFARVEITPKNGNYLDLEQNWIYRIDEQAKPNFLDTSHEFMCKEAFDKWIKKVYTFNLKEAKNPINPLIINPPKKITRSHLLLLKTWSMVRGSVGDSVWNSVGNSVGNSVWDSVGDSVWDSVGNSVGNSVRNSVGDSVWDAVSDSVSDSVRDAVRDSVWGSVGSAVWGFSREYSRGSVGSAVWYSVGDSVWGAVGAYIGSLFVAVQEWKYIDYSNPIYQRGIYPFQACVDLWKMGLVASYDGKKWRLHGGKDARILWEGTKEDLDKIK
jgi:hypothetical protein